MGYILFLFLALLRLVSCSRSSQQVISIAEQPSTFLQTSIFGRRLDLNSLSDPVLLPPSHRIRDSDDGYFDGVGAFAIDITDCTKVENNGSFDIGIVGNPFDLGVSYRPGARFGPSGARRGARRLSPMAGWE